MRRMFISIAFIFLFCIMINAQSTAYRVYTRISLPLTCSKTASSTDVVVLFATGAIYTCVNPVAVYPANWGTTTFTGGTITSSILPNAANTLDLGSSGFAFRTGYFGTSIISPEHQASTSFRITTFGAYAGVQLGNRFQFNNGNIQVFSSSNAEILRFTDSLIAIGGGITSSFPAIKRNGTKLQARLADDSAQATFQSSSAFVYRTVVQAIPHAVWTSIQWDNELDDTNVFHDNTTNSSRITINATTAGKITLKCSIGTENNATGIRVIRIYKNGSTIVAGPISNTPIANGDPTVIGIHVDIPDAVNGDYYECQLYQGNSGAGALNTTAGRETMFFSLKSY